MARKLGPLMHVDKTNVNSLWREWFRAKFWTHDNQAQLDRTEDYTEKLQRFRIKIRLDPKRPAILQTAGTLVFNRKTGEVRVEIDPEYAHYFDDTEAVMKKMRES